MESMIWFGPKSRNLFISLSQQLLQLTNLLVLLAAPVEQVAEISIRMCCLLQVQNPRPALADKQLIISLIVDGDFFVILIEVEQVVILLVFDAE